MPTQHLQGTAPGNERQTEKEKAEALGSEFSNGIIIIEEVHRIIKLDWSRELLKWIRIQFGRGFFSLPWVVSAPLPRVSVHRF